MSTKREYYELSGDLTKLKHALEPVNYQVMYEMLVLKNAK